MYENIFQNGTLLNPYNLPEPLQTVANQIEAELKAQLEVAQKAPESKSQGHSQNKGIIGLVNDAYPLETVLGELGYGRFSENRFLHPDSSSGSPGVVLLKNDKGEMRYFSHHSPETDPLADEHTHDAFDLLCKEKFDGDISRAVAHYASELDPEGQKQRQREYVAKQELTRAIDGFGIVDVHTAATLVVNWIHPNGNGGAKNTMPNLKQMLDNYGVSLRYNTISKRMEVIYPGKNASVDNERNTDLTMIYSLAGVNGFPHSKIPEYMLAIADSNQHNPIMDYIQSEEWDGQSRIDELVATLKTPSYYNRGLLRLLLLKWLISCVAAAAMPSGFHSRGVLVLQGEQALGKTSWLRLLCAGAVAQYFLESALLDPANKDTVFTILEHWIVELGELDSTFKRDIARLKGFLTQSTDKIRRPYARADSEHPRRTVFAASVNDSSFLIDDTGNSRFWVIPVIGLDYLHNINMQQLWAEVYQLYKAGATWWLTPEEEQQLSLSNEDYRRDDFIEDLIRSRYAEDSGYGVFRWEFLIDVLRRLGIEKPTNTQLQKAGKILTNLGYKKERTRSGRRYLLPLNMSEIAELFSFNATACPADIVGIDWWDDFLDFQLSRKSMSLQDQLRDFFDLREILR